jgi:hypothetical protein
MTGGEKNGKPQGLPFFLLPGLNAAGAVIVSDGWG